MSKYTAKNMSLFFGDSFTDDEIPTFAGFIESQGWKLRKSNGLYHAYRNGKEMTEEEWEEVLQTLLSILKQFVEEHCNKKV